MSDSQDPHSAAFLDTNVIVRYLMNDPPEMADRAGDVIESDADLRLSVLVLAETGFVLTKTYGISRTDAVNALISFVNRSNIEVHEIPSEIAVKALSMCQPSGRVSFADALLWATIRSHGNALLWSFDRSFPGEGIQTSSS